MGPPNQTSERIKDSADVAIVGGGVIGLSIARALALRGVTDVVVVERCGPGGEASSAAAGMLAPQAEADHADDFFKLCVSSRDLYQPFSEALRDESGIDIELDATGTIYVAVTEEDESECARRYEWQTKAGLAVERMSAVDARMFEPCISESISSALRFPLDVQVENRRIVSALAESNKHLGIKLVTGTTVESLRCERDQVKGLETSRGFVSTPNVVLAAGAWSSSLLKSDKAMRNLRIEPVRGQMVCLASNPRLAHHVIYSPRGYIVPRLDGRLLAGSTTECAGFDKRVTAAGIQAILLHALEISPEVAGLSLIECWAGLRPRAPDGLPVLGPCAEIAGLFYATGHYRNGILLAPITGEVIADAIVNRSVSPLITPFAPERFARYGNQAC